MAGVDLRSAGVFALVWERGIGRTRIRTTAISIPQASKRMGQDIFIGITSLLYKAIVGIKRFILKNAYLRLFPNYDEVLSVSMMIWVDEVLSVSMMIWVRECGGKVTAGTNARKAINRAGRAKAGPYDIS